MAGDDEELNYDRRQESNEQRAARHYAEGRVQWASLENLQKLADTVQVLANSVQKIDERSVKTDENVVEMRTWFVGEVTPSGEQRPGVLATMRELRRIGNLLVWFAGASATALIGAIVALLLHIPIHP